MNGRYDREACIALLKNKQATIRESGRGGYPKRSDFSDEEVVAIKAFLGPWPRALEAAELKPKRDSDRAALNREKRIRAKRRRVQVQKERKNRLISENGGPE